MHVTDGFVDAMLAAPLGVTLLAVVEARARGREWRVAVESSPAAVDAAVGLVDSMSFGEFVDLAVLTGVIYVGPWIGDAPTNAAVSYRHARERVAIAEAVARRFGSELHQPMRRDAQQWWAEWITRDAWLERLAPLFRRYDDVYGSGQFTWAGLWTVTDPPDAVHEQLLAAWEFEQGPVGRWWLPVVDEARVFEIHRPADWARLVTEHPHQLPREPDGPPWELPTAEHSHRTADSVRSPATDRDLGELEHAGSDLVFGVPDWFVAAPPTDVSALFELPGQRAARASHRRHIVPDWASVAQSYDGVHLSWAGFITSEGCVTDLGDGDVAMLRYWFSERTHWLADVFGTPRRLDHPVRSDPGGGTPAVPTDAQRCDIERALDRLLGR